MSADSVGMRTRNTIISLLALYAIVSTAYFVSHKDLTQTSKLRAPGSRPPRNAEADVNLPVAPPFPEPKLAPAAGPELLARAQLENELRYTDLQSFVCNERMNRFRGRLNGDNGRQIDTVNTHVSFENGVENYSDIMQNNNGRSSLSSIPGAWSEGEFGTLLRQTRTLLATQPVTLKTTTDLDGTPAEVYSLDVPGQDSPWELMVKTIQFRVPFRTEVAIEKATGKILQIKRTSMAMPPSSGISEIQWSVVLKPVQMDGKVWLLPATGEYSVLYAASNRREWNVMNFSDYQHYTSRAVIHF